MITFLFRFFQLSLSMNDLINYYGLRILIKYYKMDEESQPKKRGRPSKTNESKNESKDESKDEPKKRGRKPKMIIEEGVVTDNTIKKRGRKPKDKLIENEEPLVTVDDEKYNDSVEVSVNAYENIILHIPYVLGNKTNDTDFYNDTYNDENLKLDPYTYYPSLGDPQPLESSFSNNSELLNFESLEHDENKQKLDIARLNDKMTNSKINHKLKDYKDIINDIIIDNEEESNKMDVGVLVNFFNDVCKNDNYNVYPEKTDVCCWWCCHKFTTIPISLPYKYSNNMFHSYGVFCSFNCAAAYNFNTNDYNCYERYALLNLLYQKITKSKTPSRINLAGPKELLKIFGGCLSIESYRRNNVTNEKSYKLVMPPIMSIMPQVEEHINYMTNNKNDYRLKRKKPIDNKSKTLESFICCNK